MSAKIMDKISGLDDTTASSSVITIEYKFSKNLGTTLSHNGEIKQVPF